MSGTSQIDTIKFKDSTGATLKTFAAPFAMRLGGAPAGNVSGSTIVVGGDGFPIGSVFIGVNLTNPNTLLGYGTWTYLGLGKIELV